MKKKMITIAILLVLFCLPYQGMAEQTIEAVNPVFTFESIPEGVKVIHDFTVKNTGDTLLKITSVLPP